MTIVLDPWQNIVDLQMGVLEADYAVCYARMSPPLTTLRGYAGVLGPYLQVQENGREINSVGDWPSGPTPTGSENRSYPEGGNGKWDSTFPEYEFPTLAKLSSVYIWHIGPAMDWGISDQIIVNVKKLREDYPNRDKFEIGMASHTVHFEGRDLPEGYTEDDISERNPLGLFVGIRTYVGDGGTFSLAPLTTRDPFGDTVENEQVVHYSGGQSEVSANFEQATGAFITIYGQNNVFQLRGMNWNIDWKRPKRSALSAGPIFTRPA